MKNFNLFSFLSHVTSGISIFLIFGGATAGFIIYSKYSFISGIAASFIAMVPGVIFLLFSEGFFIILEILKEKKKQTKILESIDLKLKDVKSSI